MKHIFRDGERYQEVMNVEPVYLPIQMEMTGKRIRELLKENGYSVRDVQGAMGFSGPQAVYKWLYGQSLPSVDNLVVLSKILHTSIDSILVVDGDFVFINLNFRLTARHRFLYRKMIE